MDHPNNENVRNYFRQHRNKILVGVLGIGCFVGMLGFVIAYAAAYSSVSTLASLNIDTWTDQDLITKEIMSKIDSKTLGEYLQWIALRPHAAGKHQKYCNMECIKCVLYYYIKEIKVLFYTFSSVLFNL
jgi:hypothetical protein